MDERRRALLVLATAVTLLLLGLAAPSSAQILPVPGSSTTTTAAPQTTTTSTTTSTTAPDDGPTPTEPGLLDGGTTTTTSTTSTTAPPADGGTEQPAVAPEDGSTPAPEGSGTGEEADSGMTYAGHAVPPEAQAIINGVHRTPPSNSRALYEAVQQLVDLGLSRDEAIRIGFGRFPVAGVANYVHDWLYPRWGPGFRFHLGTDVFAPYGTPLRAPVDGTVTSGNGSLGGLYVKVHMDDGTYFYMAHMSGLVDGFTNGMAVKTGDIVGYIGDSGNAKGGAPHVHFSVYPQGGDPVDPKPILDRWLSEAMDALPGVVEQVRASRPTATASAPAAPRKPGSLLATSLLRPLFDERADGGVSTAVLLETVGNPSSGGLAMAATEAQAMASGIDWNEIATTQRARRRIVEDAVHKTEALLRIALGPLAAAPQT